MKPSDIYDPKKALQRLKASSNRYWCPVPWMSASTTTDGHYRLCVQANKHRQTRGLLKDESGNLLHARQVSVSESRNGELAKEVRQSMLQGQSHSACERCLQEEEAGLMSRRVMTRAKYSDDKKLISLEKCQTETSDNGEIVHAKFPILELDLRLGNRCNLSCRSCSPSESSSWYQEWAETRSSKFRVGQQDYVLEKQANKKSFTTHIKIDWFADSRLRDHLIDDCPNLQALAIVGGEPLLIEEHFQELERLINLGQSGQIVLEYNSNLTILPDRVLQLWSKFKEVKIGISLDGVDSTHDYIRYPSKFSVLRKNIAKLQQAHGKFDLWITFTLMAYNALYITELIQWTIQSGFYKSNHPSNLFFVPHALNHPRELSVAVLPLLVRERVREKFNQFRQGWFSEQCHQLSQEERELWFRRLDYLQGYLFRSLDQQEFLDVSEFTQATARMDQYRQQKMSEMMPELSSLLSQTATPNLRNTQSSRQTSDELS